jgi:hypothetical protein
LNGIERERGREFTGGGGNGAARRERRLGIAWGRGESTAASNTSELSDSG